MVCSGDVFELPVCWIVLQVGLQHAKLGDFAFKTLLDLKP